MPETLLNNHRLLPSLFMSLLILFIDSLIHCFLPSQYLLINEYMLVLSTED